MFYNIGDKIKTLAKVMCWIGSIASIIIGIVLIVMDEDLILVGILIAAVGALLSWISSFVLYGFGQLIENSDIVAEQSSRSNQDYYQKVQINEEQKERKKVKDIQRVISDDNISEDTYIDIICPECGEQLSYLKSEIISNEILICPICEASIPTTQYRK